jgi:hypothetical protein
VIPIEKLKQVRTIITHANCPDGIASAILLHDALPSAQIRFLTHGTKEYRELVPENGMLFCDIAPPAMNAGEFLRFKPIVLDHHKSAGSLVQGFEHHVFADEKLEPGVSGAVLAFREVWSPVRKRSDDVHDHRFYRAKGFAEMAGIRDTWQTSNTFFGLSCYQAEALHFWPVNKWLGIADPFDGTDMANMLTIGSVLFEKKLEAAKKALSQSWRTTVNNIRCVVFEGTTLTSDVAELVGDDADLIVGFGFVVEDGKFMLNVSTRSHTTFDCAAFAKQHGGGGHTKAAGFTVPFGPRALNPYSFFRGLLDPHSFFRGLLDIATEA